MSLNYFECTKECALTHTYPEFTNKFVGESGNYGRVCYEMGNHSEDTLYNLRCRALKINAKSNRRQNSAFHSFQLVTIQKTMK